MSVAAFVALGTLTVFVYPLFATLRHELFPGTGHVSLWGDGVMYQLANRKGSGTLWSPGSTRYNLFHTWLNTDHWILLVGAGAALLCLGSRRFRPIGLAWLLWVLPLLKPGGYLPAMYVIAGLPFAAMAIAGCGDMLTRFVLSRSWFDRSVRWGALALCWAVVGAALVWLVPSNTAKPDTHAVVPQEQALAYLTPLLRSNDNILTDDAFWLDLVRAGHGLGGQSLEGGDQLLPVRPRPDQLAGEPARRLAGHQLCAVHRRDALERGLPEVDQRRPDIGQLHPAGQFRDG